MPAVFSAPSSFWQRYNPKSREEATAPAVMVFWSSTILAFTTSLQYGFKVSYSLKCVVAFFVFKNPAAPSKRLPVQIETLYGTSCAVFSQLRNAWSVCSGLVPNPPGIMIMSYAARSGFTLSTVISRPKLSFTEALGPQSSHSKPGRWFPDFILLKGS